MRSRGTETLWELAAPLAGVALVFGFVAFLVWGHPSTTFVTIVWAVSYVALIVKDLGIRLAFLATVALCIFAVPFLYALVLLIQLPLVVFGLVPFHAHVYFVRSLYGALVGATIGFTAFKDRAEESADEIVPNLGRPGYRLRWGELFDLSRPKSSAVIGIVLLVPCLFVLPATTSGIVASGVIWGIVMGLAEAVIVLRVEDQSVRQGWKRVGFLELLTGILFISEVAYYWIDRAQFRWFMAFLPAGAVCYAATYGLIHLTAIVTARLGVTWPAGKGDDEVPGRATSAIAAVLTGDVLDRMAVAIRGYLDRDARRTIRIRLPSGEEIRLDGPAVEPIIAEVLAQATDEQARRHD